MARYYKRRYRKRSLRRSYRRYPYSRYYASRKKYFRRKRASKVEYKRVERSASFAMTYTRTTAATINQQNNIPGIYGDYIRVQTIGANTSSPININIGMGTGVNQRIGAKINPVKLRLFGTVSYNCSAANSMIMPSSIIVRCVVFQVRNGNGAYLPNDEQFSSINPIFDFDAPYTVNMSSGKRLFSNFYGEMAAIILNNQTYQVPFVRNDNRDLYTSLGRVPFKLGIGSAIKVLKDKTYTMNTGHKTTYTFRLKTKKPNRMVWVENDNNENSLSSNPRNPIYIMWFVIPTAPFNYSEAALDLGTVTISSSLQMFYTDS